MVLTGKTSAGYGIKLPKMQVICGLSCSQGRWPRQNFWAASGVALTVISGANRGMSQSMQCGCCKDDGAFVAA